MLQWTRQYGSDPNKDNTFVQAVLDSQENIIIAESICLGVLNHQRRLIKYSPDSTVIWDVNAGNFGFRPPIKSLEVDGLDNIIIFADDDTFLTKYSPDGELLWSLTDITSMEGETLFDVTTDNTGNIYLCGIHNSEMLTIKLDPNGNEVWSARYKPPDSAYAIAEKIAYDGLDSIYVSGIYNSSGGEDLVIIKYNTTDGVKQWSKTKHYTGGLGGSIDGAAVDSSGNFYILYPYSVSDDYTILNILKFDSAGNELFCSTYSGEVLHLNNIEIDSQFNVYIAANIIASPGNYQALIIKYDAGGTEKWIKTYDGYVTGLAVDFQDFVTILYQQYETFYPYPLLSCNVVSYDPEDNQAWLMLWWWDEQTAEKILTKGRNLYFAGEIETAGGTTDLMLMKYRKESNCVNPPTADLTDDCKVNAIDFAILAEGWPVDMEVLNLFVEQWLDCGYANPYDCLADI